MRAPQAKAIGDLRRRQDRSRRHSRATMASEEFSEASEAKRPNVQVGDPFLEKLLLEACLEAMQTGAIVGHSDMGAAGLPAQPARWAGVAGVGIGD